MGGSNSNLVDSTSQIENVINNEIQNSMESITSNECTSSVKQSNKLDFSGSKNARIKRIKMSNKASLNLSCLLDSSNAKESVAEMKNDLQAKAEAAAKNQGGPADSLGLNANKAIGDLAGALTGSDVSNTVKSVVNMSSKIFSKVANKMSVETLQKCHSDAEQANELLALNYEGDMEDITQSNDLTQAVDCVMKSANISSDVAKIANTVVTEAKASAVEDKSLAGAIFGDAFGGMGSYSIICIVVCVVAGVGYYLYSEKKKEE